MTSEAGDQVTTSIESLNQPLRARVDAVEEANQRALEKSEADNREKINELRRTLEEKINAADVRLEDRMEALKELLTLRMDENAKAVEIAFESYRESTKKSDEAIEKRLEAFDQLWTEIRTARSESISRDMFEQDRAEARRRDEAFVAMANDLGLRITEMEARGVGEKDTTAEIRATFAVGVAVVAMVASTVIGLLAVFGG